MKIIWTIGHSTRPIEDFVLLLKENGIQCLVDVRSYPSSRKNPQFNQDALNDSLSDSHIKYVHLPSVGGKRSKQADMDHEMNGYWTHPSFHNYADYALTQDFQDGLSELIQFAQSFNTAMMCSEAVWWKCHRRILTDYMLSRQFIVKHIMGHNQVNDAQMFEGAIVQNNKIIYPSNKERLTLESFAL